MERKIKIREMLEEREEKILHSKAAFARRSKGRMRHEEDCDIRTCFQRDRDRIIHCKSFRRLKHKTQVFLAPAGDHYRTRLTHTLEVSQVARSIARSLCLNEDLAEAISLAHDLGHTPFGHAGERVLDRLMPGGFHHYSQSLRVVDELEYEGKGLNLTYEVRDGIMKHSKGEGEILPGDPEKRAATLEGDIVRISDVIAYVNHDVDDALRARMISPEDIPRDIRSGLGETSPKRIDTLVKDVVYSSLACDLEQITMNHGIMGLLADLRSFLFENVYEHERSKKEFIKAENILLKIYEEVMKNPASYFSRELEKEGEKTREKIERLAFDFIAGMTDRYAITLFNNLFIPTPCIGMNVLQA
ncbi:MAG: deoxyguanosinetriphosphate triphosphohydrolase [Acidobacteriota bacterium]